MAILSCGYTSNDGLLSISAAFVNSGNKDEIVLDYHALLAADKSKPEWRPLVVDANDLFYRVGKESFVVPAGAGMVKRLEWKIREEDMPYTNVLAPNKGKRTDIGVHVALLGRGTKMIENNSFFASVTAMSIRGMLEGGGDAKGFLQTGIDPRIIKLRRY